MAQGIVNSVGLVLDIFGVLILFKFGFPQPDFAEHNRLAWARNPDAPMKRR